MGYWLNMRRSSTEPVSLFEATFGRFLQSGCSFRGGAVDPGGCWKPRRGGWLADEPFRAGGIGGGQGDGAGGGDVASPAVVDVGGGVQRDAGVAMLIVLPGEEFLAPGAGGLGGTESARV